MGQGERLCIHIGGKTRTREEIRYDLITYKTRHDFSGSLLDVVDTLCFDVTVAAVAIE